MVEQFIEQIISEWGTYWSTYSTYMNSFGEFGFSGMRMVIDNHADRQTTGTLKIVGAIYTIARALPFVLFFYALFLKFTENRLYSILSAIGLEAVLIYIMSYRLDMMAKPTEVYETVAYGPMSVLDGLYTGMLNEPTTTSGAIAMFVVFFVISYFAWYSVVFMMYGLTLMFKKTPLFSESSGKGHALWLTLMWVFFLTLLPGAIAFINTLAILGAMMMNRSRKQGFLKANTSDKKGGKSREPKEVMVVDTSDSNVKTVSDDEVSSEDKDLLEYVYE